MIASLDVQTIEHKSGNEVPHQGGQADAAGQGTKNKGGNYQNREHI